jgi:hypothetical protein
MKNANEPISPCLIEGEQGYGVKPTIPNRNVHGLTKREYFAGLCLSTLVGSINLNGIRKLDDQLEYAVHIAIRSTDELLKQLEK